MTQKFTDFYGIFFIDGKKSLVKVSKFDNGYFYVKLPKWYIARKGIKSNIKKIRESNIIDFCNSNVNRYFLEQRNDCVNLVEEQKNFKGFLVEFKKEVKLTSLIQGNRNGAILIKNGKLKYLSQCKNTVKRIAGMDFDEEVFDEYFRAYQKR